MPIIRLCHDTKALTIKLVQPGCNGGQLIDYENLRLVITAPACSHRITSPLCFTGCWPGFETPWTDAVYPHELPALIYPAFEINDKGETVFRLDSQLRRLPAGRYIGSIELKDGTPLAEIEIDMCNLPALIDTVSVNDPTC